MANVFVTLTPPAGNGSGAAIDVSAMGADKTITVGSSGGVYEPTTTIEVSNDTSIWTPLVSVQGRTERQVSVACKYMRQTVAGFIDGSVPSVSVGGAAIGTGVSAISVPAANGIGAALIASTLRDVKTIQVGGTFKGIVNIEISEDNGLTYSVVASFTAPGIQTSIFAADHIRVVRQGVPVVGGGQPVASVASTDIGAGGSGGTGFTTPPFLYTANGTESPAGFSIAFPTGARGGKPYVAQVGLAGVANMVVIDVPSISYADDHIVVKTSGQLSNGDNLSVGIFDS